VLKGLSRSLLGAALCAISLPALAQQGPRATPVVTAQAELRTMAPVSWVAGTVVSKDYARISAEVASRLEQVADVGTSAKQGDTLAKLDTTLLQADLNEAKANVAKERANLTFLKSEVERLQRLAKQNNAAQNQLEETLAQRDATVSELAGAEARLQIATESLRRSNLIAPFDGVVVTRDKRVGEWVSQGEVVLRFTNPDRVEIETLAPARFSPYIKLGQPVLVKVDDKQIEAPVSAMVPAADPSTGLLQVRLALEESPWLSGQAVRVALPTAERREVLTVPRDALVLRRGSIHLFKVNAEQMAELVPVQTGIAAGDYIQVMGSLQNGDRVVTRGNERLRPGMPVMDRNANKGAQQ